MTTTQATVRFGADGPAGVESFVRLTGRTYIYCHTYDDAAPILSIDDKHVSVSLTVPDTRQVTADDVAWARLLAGAVARYVTELEKLAAADREDTAAPGDHAGQAA